MKKTMISIVAGALMGLTAQAQVQPNVLGENHAMVRLESGSKYVLLPVEEKAENASVRVIGRDNQCVRRPNVRLAGQVLDIIFHGDRRTKGAIKEFACWKEIKFSNTFDTTNREKFRPAYHHTPQYGWMNDPNGMFYKDGEWHLYYQYNPYGSLWENMTWGHSVSKDLIHWEAMPLAIEADAIGTIFSGSCVVDKDNTAGFGRNAVIAFYTSAGEAQTQSMAYSTDGGRTFNKYEKNPVVTFNAPDFRDPKVFWYEGTKRWIMMLAVGQEMQIWSSANLKDWQKESSFGSEYGNHGGVWECPDMLKIEDKWVLICNINPGGPFGGSATQYFVGDFDGKKFTCESMPKVTKWLDYGKDHYATVSFSNAPDGRTVVLAWMSNWQYANQVPTRQFRSANSIARDLGSMELTLSNAKGEQVVMKYDAQKQTFAMDRKQSGDVSFSEAFPIETVAPTHGALKQLRLFIDHSSIEAFASDGKMAMTNLVFPSEPYNMIKVKGGKATIYEIK